VSSVIDASVVLAWLQDEPGSDLAERHLVEGIIGAANWSEVLQKARQHGAEPGLVARLLTSFGLPLGLRLDLSVVTTHAEWRSVRQGPKVILAR
jgi:PIN domain nuclease of toxin-antitoxin system